jgi:uncharacterized protein YbcI
MPISKKKLEAEISSVENLTHCKVLSSHSDISTKMGERIEVFIVDKDLEKLLIE